MICPKCGLETSYVICNNCNTNVIWYKKYGLHDDCKNNISEDCIIENSIDNNFEDTLSKIFKNKLE